MQESPSDDESHAGIISLESDTLNLDDEAEFQYSLNKEKEG